MGLIKESDISLVPQRSGACTTSGFIEIITETDRFTISPGQEFELANSEHLIIHKEDNVDRIPWKLIKDIRCEDPVEAVDDAVSAAEPPRHLWFSFNSWISKFSFSHKDGD